MKYYERFVQKTKNVLNVVNFRFIGGLAHCQQRRLLKYVKMKVATWPWDQLCLHLPIVKV